MSAEQIAAQVRGAVGLSMQDGRLIVVAPQNLKVERAREMDEQGMEKDVALFAAKEADKRKLCELAERLPRVGEGVYMFGVGPKGPAPKLTAPRCPRPPTKVLRIPSTRRPSCAGPAALPCWTNVERSSP